MADASPGLPEIRRTLDRHERRLVELETTFVRRDVYQAERDAALARITRLETEDATRETGNRTWLLGLVQVAFGAVLAVVGAYLMARGHA